MVSVDGSQAEEEVAFEETIDRLTVVVERLESSEEPLALEESLALFEEGVGLARKAATSLERAERRVEVLLADGTTEPTAAVGDEGR